jgi:hypothetical protein
MNMNSAVAGDTSSRVALDRPLLEKALNVCIGKTRGNITRLADEPKSAAWALDGNYFNFKEDFYEIGNWTSSFFTGMALLAWRETEDEFFLNQVQRLAPHYRAKVFTHHLLSLLTLFRRALQIDRRQESSRSRPARRRGVGATVQREGQFYPRLGPDGRGGVAHRCNESPHGQHGDH